MKICAIHQPNFFPWLGYFDKIKQADIFIFLDNVAYPKSGSGAGSWVNRVKLLIANEPRWFGCPIKREKGIQVIKDVLIDDSQPWRQKSIKTLEMNYKRCQNFDFFFEMLKKLLNFPTDNLSEFNINVIQHITTMLGYKTKFFKQSVLDISGEKTELLINLVKQVGADTYLCGNGAQGYQKDQLFFQQSIQLKYQNFEFIPYGKIENFQPGLSVIDYLMKVICIDTLN